MLDAELAEIVANLRVLGTDIADVEVKNSHGGLSKSLRETQTGLNDQTVRRWLAIMRDEGSVEFVGTSPRSTSARYRRARQGALFPSSGSEGAP